MTERARRIMVAAQQRADAALARALKATAMAKEVEQTAAAATSGHPALARSAAHWRRSAEVHFEAARLQLLTAHVMRLHLDAEEGMASLPPLLAAVGRSIGVRSAAVTLLTRSGQVALAVATDARSRAAQAVEIMLGEGPACDAVSAAAPVVARRAEIGERWPEFESVAAAVGIHAVAAVPVGSADVVVGAVEVFDPTWSSDASGVESLRTVAEALGDPVIGDVLAAELAQEGEDADDVVPPLHAAAGLVSSLTGRPIDDALAMIRARAFVEGASVRQVAQSVLDGSLDLEG